MKGLLSIVLVIAFYGEFEQSTPKFHNYRCNNLALFSHTYFVHPPMSLHSPTLWRHSHRFLLTMRETACYHDASIPDIFLSVLCCCCFEKLSYRSVALLTFMWGMRRRSKLFHEKNIIKCKCSFVEKVRLHNIVVG